ncbi:MAG: LptF/LptG family permease [Albidovulum sp.]|nr:LptF/LptG family permease [Albidovulum sp.]
MRFLQALAATFLLFFCMYFLEGTVQISDRFMRFEIELFKAAELALMRIAIDLYTLLPIIVGLAALAMSFLWFRSSEMVAVRSAGISALAAMCVPALCAFLFGIVSIALLNPLVAILTDQFRISAGKIDASLVQSEWIRNGEVVLGRPGQKSESVIRATLVDETKFEFQDADIFLFADDGTLTHWILAETAMLEDSRWQLSNGKIWRIDSDSPNPEKSAVEFEEYELPTDLTRDQVNSSLISLNFVSFWEIEKLIELRERAGISSVEFKVFYSAELAKPLLFAALVLVGAGFTTRPARVGPASIKVLLAALTVLGIYYFSTFTKVLAENERISPFAAAWLPPTVALALALTQLLVVEDG